MCPAAWILDPRLRAMKLYAWTLLSHGSLFLDATHAGHPRACRPRRRSVSAATYPST